ncbi:Xylose isomerase-like TIM barrel [Pirellulimonas nuda]|uniref:Xylose isomerase-like TIM barrel n=1 Tax=Pirellulimonas nuda TaxID=2528009 RepID=A0A518DFI8_9BACT|nr:sugar phosphate isomerase/epimerase family protein [Pirellulimonas nuda]QDU90202.1 Xylose isomerase-like TIM barrel [Pirellulimonas nuda]
MSDPQDRRRFLGKSVAVAAGLGLAGGAASAWAQEGKTAETKVQAASAGREPGEPLFEISLAEWSLHNALRAGKITNLDFPGIAKGEFGINAVEYVNAFFKDKANDTAYLSQLKARCDDLGVHSLLIMCDGEGQLGDPDSAAREKSVENHYRWVEAANLLGCHSIRVNAASSGSYEEQQKLAADGLARLGEFAEGHNINVLVENHGGLSSNGKWLAGVMEKADRPNVGTLPDFGNFYEYDRYEGVAELMPYAKAVSAKSHVFDDKGNESQIDYFKMMKIVLEAGYRGFVGVEWEGKTPDEYEGIRLTKQLLERVRDSLA